MNKSRQPNSVVLLVVFGIIPLIALATSLIGSCSQRTEQSKQLQNLEERLQGIEKIEERLQKLEDNVETLNKKHSQANES